MKPIVKQEFNTKAERLAALKRSATSINKKLGIECVTLASNLKTPPRAKFGIPALDSKINGLPHGNFYTFWGSPKSGKTALALYLAAQAQKEGKLVAWGAGEPFDPERAKQFGINLEELALLQFPKAELLLDTMISYAQDKICDVFVLDSIHSLAPKRLVEGKDGSQKSLEDNTMGLIAAKLSDFFKVAIDPIKRSEMCVFLIAQTRKNLGGIIVLDQLTGGNALIHNSRVIAHVRRGAKDDAPTRTSYVETDELDAKVNKKKKRVETIIGFNCVIKLDAMQISDCVPEQTIIQLPYYFESGFDLPADIKAEIEKDELEIKQQGELMSRPFGSKNKPKSVVSSTDDAVEQKTIVSSVVESPVEKVVEVVVAPEIVQSATVSDEITPIVMGKRGPKLGSKHKPKVN
jgi:RecA/RadA recombinase